MTGLQHRPGWVYVMSNSVLPKNVLKIGLTQTDCMARMRAVASSHKVPGEWRLEFRAPVRDCFEAELAVHRALDAKRLSWEFFKITVDSAKVELRRVTRPWRCTEADVKAPIVPTGTTHQVVDRATRAKEAALKAHVTRKRKLAAHKAVATRRARLATTQQASNGSERSTSE